MTINDYPAMCYLFGCKSIDVDYPYCERCGRGPYDNQANGLVWEIRNGFYIPPEAIENLWPLRKCDNCGKKMITLEKYPLCSEKCKDEWIPF